ncbi:hypothetical protein SCHPADRAFT_939782 [Schizopora paradoxa]|uniref:F-box domain-containing protein n=1 Tax=Schizopora paradoxa TaxID=27342 RepID=A0A0H2SB34_9AGAM|nr:hypothetical protein SCHPADRAFT_939782 [Schizopora paradoxa]
MDIAFKIDTELQKDEMSGSNLKNASISSLNLDALLEIFEHGCSEPASIAPEKTVIVAPALTYSQVCRSWRSLVTAQSTLWSTISWGTYSEELVLPVRLQETEGSAVADERFVALWDLYLSRSGDALLDATVYFFLKKHCTRETRQHILESIFKEQHRLKYLKISCDYSALPEEKTYYLTMAPRLEILEINGTHCGGYHRPFLSSASLPGWVCLCEETNWSTAVPEESILIPWPK